MAAPLRIRRRPARRQSPPDEEPRIRLRHGQAVWLLSQLGFQGGASDKTFYEYVKSLRKLGLPFPRERRKAGSPRLVNYGFGHLMELALALSLRVYHGLPDAVLVELIRHREELYSFYLQAYWRRATGVGAKIRVEGASTSFEVQGAFLDLQINYNGGALASFGPPRLLSPSEAIKVYATSTPAARAMLPIKLSDLAESIVELAGRAPSVRSGPEKSAERPLPSAPKRALAAKRRQRAEKLS